MKALTVNWRLLSVLGCLLLLPAFVTADLQQHWASWQALLLGHPVYFWLGCLIAGMLGVSRQLLASLGGFLFGWWAGVWLTQSAVFLAALTIFGIGRVLPERQLTEHRFSFIRRSAKWLHRQPFQGILTLRLLPLGSNLLTNVAAGLLRLPFIAFAGASFIGFLPQHVIFSLLGEGVAIASPKLLLWGLAGLALSLLVVSYWKKQRQEQESHDPSSPPAAD